METHFHSRCVSIGGGRGQLTGPQRYEEAMFIAITEDEG